MNDLMIGSIKASELAKHYGTPLYVYDEANMTKIMNDYVSNFKSSLFSTEVIYASKAFSCKEMIKLVNKNNMGLDVVSYGELYTAIGAGFPVEKIYFHGNNKSLKELEYAIASGVGTIVVDNCMELESLVEIANKPVNIIIRLNVGIDAHTHKYIVTSHVDSKFGVGLDSNDYRKCLELIKKNSNIHLDGFHCHIGSQIFDINPYYAAIDKILDVAKTFDYPMTIDIGGGFGITYTKEDKPIAIDKVAKLLIADLENKIKEKNLTIKKIVIEPGRSIVAESGYTLYTIGYQKQTPNKKYYFIDGGMTDNIRPALYQAKYACDIVSKMEEEKTEMVTLAGKCCESGDLIVEDVMLPKASKGDIVAVYSTGAYGYSMSSNYNRVCRPAIVFVNKNQARVVVKREDCEDLVRNDCDGEIYEF